MAVTISSVVTWLLPADVLVRCLRVVEWGDLTVLAGLLLSSDETADEAAAAEETADAAEDTAETAEEAADDADEPAAVRMELAT